MRQQKNKLLAAVAAGNIYLAQTLAAALRQLHQGAVARQVPVGVVYIFEMVNIQHHQRQGGAITAGALHFAPPGFLEVAPVIQPGQRVGDG